MKNLHLWLIAEEHVPGWLPAALSDPKMLEKAQEREPKRYPVTSNGTAIVSIVGVMQKARDVWMEVFGGASTEEARDAVRTAAADPDVDALFLRIDSPGGDVAGTQELADAVYEARQAKPVAAHIEDLGASAALWVASQADMVTANESARVGSVGVVTVLADVEKALEADGITVHVVSSGEFKGLLHEPGVSEKALDYVQGQVDDLAGVFQAAIARGRGMGEKALAAVSDGRVYMAPRAQELGLIDAVMGRDEAFAVLETRSGNARKARLGALRKQADRRRARLGAELKRARRPL
jgi:signal peptide peptidase SppA